MAKEDKFEELAKKQTSPSSGRGTPQGSLLYRAVAFFTQMQLGYLLRDSKHSKSAVRIFVFLEGLAALAIISTAAFLAKLPLLFPPLGPSAFILFRTPLSRAAAPRAVFIAHNMGMVIGLAMLYLFAFLFPDADLQGSDALNWPRIFALSLAMGLTSLGMIMFNCAHPPLRRLLHWWRPWAISTRQYRFWPYPLQWDCCWPRPSYSIGYWEGCRFPPGRSTPRLRGNIQTLPAWAIRKSRTGSRSPDRYSSGASRSPVPRAIQATTELSLSEDSAYMIRIRQAPVSED
ncbi:HPP family protein [Solemya velesiana gill symbiont]|uniref:HPP transmembrane region domain-containing protein n=1 Tax=Solemya velesiana gill symbiont TaxID=1918948 RepID=A0A1T2KV18_9GAMM|nr:HPP family protein [Solemya velesiana gill symbiont]OOZ36580.1 hypothetical protein BOW51_06430 [Solemya velesiana gill symbiont]